MAEENTPRRLRRFERRQMQEEASFGKEQIPGQEAYENEKELEESLLSGSGIKKEALKNEKAMKIAVERVKEFKERHKRLPRKDEYDQIAESIYIQLKEKGDLGQSGPAGKSKGIPQTREKQPERQLHRGRTRAERVEQKTSAEQGIVPETVPVQEKEIKGLEIKDLLKGNEKELEEFKEGGEFFSESEEGSEDDFSLSGLETGGEEKSQKCPNCKKPAEEILFCPECGAAFCEQCAKTERIGSEKKIVCPKCKKTIKV